MLAPAAAHAVVADRARHGARVPRAARRSTAGRTGARARAPIALLHRPRRDRRALLSDGIRSTASSCASRCPPPLDGDPGAPRACAYALVDALAGIHALRLGARRPRRLRPARRLPRAPGAALARPARALQDAPVARGRRGRAAGSRRTRPRCSRPRVIHGDYKLDNVMFAPRLPVELVAVVDWEQSTIGDPLVDLGWVLGLWVEAGRARVARGRVAVRRRRPTCRRAPSSRSLRRADRPRPRRTSRSTACSGCSSSRA